MTVLKIDKITIEDLRTNKLSKELPKFYALKNVIENSPGHNNQTVFDHVVLVYESLLLNIDGNFLPNNARDKLKNILNENIGSKKLGELLKIATLLHDIAKPLTNTINTNGTTSNPGHEILGSSLCKEFSNIFELDVYQENIVSEIIKYHGFASDITAHIIRTGKNEPYFQHFLNIAKDLGLPVLLLFYADLHGSDLESNKPNDFLMLKNLIIELMLDITTNNL